jgi:hypothetical protein
MSDDQVGPENEQDEPDRIPPEPFTAGERMLAFDSQGTLLGLEYAEDYRNIEPWELTEAQEDYRDRAYEAVLHYARDYGLEIFPVSWMKNAVACACRDGESCVNPGKHPVDLRWPEVATSDPERAARWWRKLGPGDALTDWRPAANIGYRTGIRHFTTDIDTDDGKPGEESLARLIEQGGGKAMPLTLTWQTGGGGRQYVTLVPEGIEVRSSASKLAPGIDIRGFNGYGILPPSRSGKGEYLMLADRSPDVQCPPWEADWLAAQHRKRTEHIRSHPAGDPRQIPRDGLTKRAHGYITKAFSDAVRTVRAAEKTKRNTTLNDEAFDLFAKFAQAGLLGADDITAAMQAAGEACGLGSDEVERTIGSARDGGLRKDRSGELPDFLFEEPGEEDQDELEAPDPLTDIMTPWLPRELEVAVTGLDRDNRVRLEGRKNDTPNDVLRLSWAVALGYASPHIATLGRDLVVVSGGEHGSLDIGQLDARRLRNLCAGGLTYYHDIKVTEEENGTVTYEELDVPLLPSAQLCSTVLADPAIRLYRPVLAAITKVPVLRPDGTLLERQGVDQATAMIYWPDLPAGPIPAAPGRSEVAASRHLLLDEMLHDFPWSSAADKANCLGMLLTSYLQPYARFLSPQFVLDALKSGSGKGHLVTIMVETTGAYFRTWVNDEAEIRKALTACLMESDPVIIFDDVDKRDTVASATLASALTKRQWDDRVLGVSKNFRGENNRTWVLTGNNVKLGGDIPSRSVLISLNPGATDPKLRKVSSFKLGDFDPWIRQEQNRVRVIRALLTLITAWADHGAPRSDVHHRFAEWAAVVGGVLEYHKVDGFLGNQARVEEHVHHDEHLASFFRRWSELYSDEPQQVSKLRETLGDEPDMLGSNDIWHGHWPKNRKNSPVTARGLASVLRDAVGQDHGGYQVDSKPDGHGHDLFFVSRIEVTDSDQEPTT